MIKQHEDKQPRIRERLHQISNAIDAMGYLVCMMKDQNNDDVSRLLESTLTILKITHSNMQSMHLKNLTNATLKTSE